MGNWLNTYQKVTSQTGTPVTLFTDHAPWRDNPWIEIRGAGRRYRNNGKGGWEIQQASQSSGTWDPVNIVDEEYWTNYVNDIDKKRKETPALNIFLKLFGIEGKTPEKACGGKVQKGEDGMKSNHYIYDKPLRKYEYNEPDYMNHYTPETDIDRTGTRPRYDAVTGRIHRTTSFKVPEVKPNFAGLMAPGEVRQYIDPKTYRIQTITGPTDPHYRSAVYEYGDAHDESIRYRMKNNNGMFYLGNDDWGEAGYDVITWPDGSRRVVLTSAQPKIYIPKGDYQIPSNPNDNTLTSGSIEKGNIKGGVYPGTESPIQAPEGYNPTGEWEETHDQVNGGVRKTWKNKETGRVTRVNPNKVQKGDNGMVAGEFPPTWNQGKIQQGFQKARPDWMQKIDDWANEKSLELNDPKKVGPISLILGPVFDYLTQRPGNIGYAAILPGVGAANAAGKAAVGKSSKFEKQLAERVAQVILQRAKDSEISALRKKALSMTDAELDKAVENAFKAKGLREQMAKWDLELITNADRDVINKTTPDWLDELTKYNDDYIKEIDLSNLIKKENPAKDWAIGLAGLSAVGIPGTYFITRDSEKKKKAKLDVKEKPEIKEKPEKKADGGKISDLLNNQEFLVNLEKCGGKMKKKACGGKMKRKK